MAVQLYIDLTDLEDAQVVAAALQQVRPETKLKYLYRASGFVATYLRKRYDALMPFAVIDDTIKAHTLSIAIYWLMTQEVGINPDNGGADKVFRDNFNDAISWLEDVVAAKVDPVVVPPPVDPGATPVASTNDRAVARSSGGRGYSTTGDNAPGLFQADRRRSRF